MSTPEKGRQFEFLPEVLRRAGEDGVALCVAAQVRGQFEYAVKIGVQRSVLPLRGSAFQSLLNDIFGNDCLATMGTVLRRIRLKIKTEGARPFGFVCLKCG